MRQFIRIFVASIPAMAAFAGIMKVADVQPPADPKKSAGLFVGVSDFDDKELVPVKYAVDDAVDLAFEVSLAREGPLVPAGRIVLALSGTPRKDESKKHLQALLDAGASPVPSTQKEILTALKARAAAAGPDGFLIVAFATHGMSEDDTQYLLARDSDISFRETAVTEGRVREIVTNSGAERALILIDACRERLTRDRRAGDTDPRSVAAFIRRMDKAEGQAVFSAAGRGHYAYDDDSSGNGVFTRAVIDGLQCSAAKDHRGFVTVETLSRYVERRVLKWIQDNKDPGARKATQFDGDVAANKMPLTICVSRTGEASLPPRP